jgi:hypothetical protein
VFDVEATKKLDARCTMISPPLYVQTFALGVISLTKGTDK